MSGWAILGGVLAYVGHVATCVSLVNRMHSTAVHYRLIKVCELPVGLWLLGAPLAAWQLRENLIASILLSLYAFFCCLMLLKVFVEWLSRRLSGPPAALLSSSSELVNVASLLDRSLAGNAVGRFCARLPGNQIFLLEITRKTLAVPRLPPALAGLTIAHLSDLHFTGRIAREYFEYQVERTLQLQADMIVVTGDILDAWECREWIPATLGRLQAPHGVYFLLGNHDLRPGHPAELRAQLVDAGLIDVGNQVTRRMIRGTTVCLAGNELPWFSPAPDVSFEGVENEFPILLSHAPDQIDWAVQRRFPLMLAGHTHGGQIVFPVLGPVVAPSRYGVRYAGGVFQERGTVMHVSRGLSGEEPLRWNCPPELALLTLAAT